MCCVLLVFVAAALAAVAAVVPAAVAACLPNCSGMSSDSEV